MSKMMVPVGMLATACILFLVGYFSSNSQAFLFPNIVSAIMILIAGCAVVNARKPDTENTTTQSIPWLVIMPALVIFVLYLALAEKTGFYLSALIAFIALVCIYRPGPLDLKVVGKISMIGLVFMSALYCLFSLLLKVQLPKGFII